MPLYSFKAYDTAGRLEQGELEADSREAALETLSRTGRFPFDIAPAGTMSAPTTTAPWWNRELFGQGALPFATLAILARELATLTKAALPIDEVLRVVALQPRIGARARRLVETVLGRVIGGASLSEALAAQGNAIPQHFWRLVRAGEVSGTLPQALDELAGFLEQSAKVRGQLVTALVYPMVLVVAALVTVAVIMTVMIPAILPLFQDAGRQPPVVVAALITLQRLASDNWPVLIAFATASIVAVPVITRSERAMIAWDRLVLRVPVVGSLVQRSATMRLARTMSTLTRNGVPMLEAIGVTAGVMRNRAFGAALRDAEREVNQGGALLAPLMRSGLLPDLALRMIALGEQTGQLPQMLARVADIYEHDVQQQLQRLLGIATPAITIVIGVVIGALILSVMSAMIGLNETVLR
jgi:general secretion pathway protein F